MAGLFVEDLVVTFGRGPTAFNAVDGVSMAVEPGAVLGVVGESGSGKSTVARTIAGLQRATSGRILIDGDDALTDRKLDPKLRAKRAQMIFQDPFSSLNPRMTVGETLEEALITHSTLTRSRRRASIAELLELVRLRPIAVDQYPEQMSGGMRQRVAIARCLAVRPRLIVADEITSALDASVQGAVLNLIKGLQAELGFSLVFITHNLAAVRYIADETAVMREGRIVEHGPSESLVDDPQHPYTQALVAAIPRIQNAGTNALLEGLEEF